MHSERSNDRGESWTTAWPERKRTATSLLPHVYDRLRATARRKMQHEHVSGTLQPTALVNEAWIRLVGSGDPGWDNPHHFAAAAAEAMRRILIEHARRKRRWKRGGDLKRHAIDAVQLHDPGPSTEALDLNLAIAELQKTDPRKARIAVLRCYGGLSPQEIAAALETSLSTVEREWRATKTWLVRALAPDASEPPARD